MRPVSTKQRRARLPLHDAARLETATLHELRALADDARDLHVFDKLIPEIVALCEVELLLLIGLFVVGESVHQAFHAASIYRFGDSNNGDR
jgi:hypothetical protein